MAKAQRRFTLRSYVHTQVVSHARRKENPFGKAFRGYQARMPCREPWQGDTAGPWCGCGCGEPLRLLMLLKFMFMKALDVLEGGSAGMLLYVQL